MPIMLFNHRCSALWASTGAPISNLERFHTRSYFRSFETRDRQVPHCLRASDADVAFIVSIDMHGSSIAEVDEPVHGEHDSILRIFLMLQQNAVSNATVLCSSVNTV